MDKRYQVFVSSTFTDLKEERKAIIEGLLNAKYIPAGMEMFAASNDEQFKYIKKIIDTCDYYVLIVGARYGSINPSTGKSFTEQEYDYAVERGIPVLAFLHDDPYNLPVEKRDDENRDLLENFRNKASDGRMCKMWHTSAELISSVIISLVEEVANNPQIGWMRGNEIDLTDLLNQLNSLRIEKEDMQHTINDLQKEIEKYECNNVEELAQGRDEFIVIGDGYVWKKIMYVEEELRYTVSWDDIFSCIAPYLYSKKTYDDFAFHLKEEINSKLHKETYFARLKSDCVQTIKVQFKTLGFIDVVSQEKTKEISVETIILTEKGKKYLEKIKTIKR